jgi:hypothetical protein
MFLAQQFRDYALHIFFLILPPRHLQYKLPLLFPHPTHTQPRIRHKLHPLQPPPTPRMTLNPRQIHRPLKLLHKLHAHTIPLWLRLVALGIVVRILAIKRRVVDLGFLNHPQYAYHARRLGVGVVEEAQVAFAHGLHVVTRLRVAHAGPGLGGCAGGKVVDGEGYVDAVFEAGEGFGF